MKLFVNLITTMRFIYTLALPVLKVKVSKLAFIINIGILFITDSIDGILARKFKVQTLYGSMMDTIADKSLCIMLLLLLVGNLQILAPVLIGEVIIALINIVATIKGKKTKSSFMGKAKMWLISITIVLSYMYYFNVCNYYIWVVSLVLTTAMQIATIINYIFRISKQENNTSQIYKTKNWEELKYILFDSDYYLSTL